MPHHVFDRLAQQYDAWFDSPKGRAIFPVEVQCLRRLLTSAPRPWLEVGVGTGRFAEALGFDQGLDPSAVVLQMARRRRVSACCGVAEALPYADHSCGCVLIVVTLCFLSDPSRALDECARVLAEDGVLIIGFVPADSPWGRLYMREGRQGHPFYSMATLYTCQQVTQMAVRAGFALQSAGSGLFDPPDMPIAEECVDDLIPGAGFVAMRFIRSNSAPGTQTAG